MIKNNRIFDYNEKIVYSDINLGFIKEFQEKLEINKNNDL